MKTIKKYLTLLISLFFTSMGIALAIKSAIGLPAFDAFNQTVADTTNIRVGTVVMIVQMFFIFLQLLLLKKEASWKVFLQVPFVILLGQFINFFVYFVFGSITIDNYILRFFIFIFSQLWTSLFISMMLVLDLIAMPVESLSMVLSKKSNFNLSQIRQAIDILLILLSLALTFIFSSALNIREGTVISALIFGPLLGFYIPRLIPHFKKWELINKEESFHRAD